MKTPVIIAAQNEAELIGRTLAHMDAAAVVPVVVINGSTDATAEVVESFGLKPIVREEPGKLPAIQDALELLGRRALEPVLFTDADSYPRSPKQWPAAMTRLLSASDRPAAVSGMVAFCDSDAISVTVRNALSVRRAKAAHRAGSTGRFFGFNMGVHLQNSALLDEILELPHTWPGEDRLMADTVVRAGGVAIQSLNRDTTVRTSSRYFSALWRRLFTGAEAAQAHCAASYYRRAAPGATHYYLQGQLLPYTDLVPAEA